ncbi:MAG: DUF6683 family protein [Steroidobacteraceae bacterium]
MLNTLRALVFAGLSLTAVQSHAQYVPIDFTSQTFNSMNITAGYLLNKSMLDGASAQAAKPAPVSKQVATTTSGNSNVAHELAQSFPESDRAAAEESFSKLLQAFAQLESSLGVAHGDAAVAMACLVIGSYEAYHDETLDPATYKPVISQLQNAMAKDASFAGLDAGVRRAQYERMAILGMYVLATRDTLRRQPSANRTNELRQAAAGYLRQLQLDPETMSIDESGIEVGDEPTVP